MHKAISDRFVPTVRPEVIISRDMVAQVDLTDWISSLFGIKTLFDKLLATKGHILDYIVLQKGRMMISLRLSCTGRLRHFEDL